MELNDARLERLSHILRSTRYRVARAGDADPVIGEGRVHAGEFDFGYVTGYALFRTQGTGGGVTSSGLGISWFRDMAGETFRIVVRRVFLELREDYDKRHNRAARHPRCARDY